MLTIDAPPIVLPTEEELRHIVQEHEGGADSAARTERALKTALGARTFLEELLTGKLAVTSATSRYTEDDTREVRMEGTGGQAGEADIVALLCQNSYLERHLDSVRRDGRRNVGMLHLHAKDPTQELIWTAGTPMSDYAAFAEGAELQQLRSEGSCTHPVIVSRAARQLEPAVAAIVRDMHARVRAR